MRTVSRVASVLACLAALCLPQGASAFEVRAAPEIPLCERDLPPATDGTLTLDAATVQAGTAALGVLDDFAQWPEGLVGGGSGETFYSCTPWLADAEVISTPDAALFLVDVPAGTAPGTYPVSIVFREGSTQPVGDGTLVRLSTTVTVTSEPVGSAPGPACSLPGGPAGVGQVVGDDTAVVGDALTVGLSDVSGTVWYFNEYDRLWAVACLDGRAVVVLQDLTTAPVDLALPVGLPPGAYTLRVWGILDGAVVWWERAVTVTAAPAPPAPEPGPATVESSRRSCASVTVSGSGWGPWAPAGSTVRAVVVGRDGTVVGGPVAVAPDAQGVIQPARVDFASPPRNGQYAAVVTVDGVERGRSAEFTLRGCRPELPATGASALPLAALGTLLLAAGLAAVRATRTRSAAPEA